MDLGLIRRVYSWILVIARVAVAIIVILAIYSVAAQKISIEDVGTPYLEMEGTNVTVKIPVTLRNYGYYDIQDIAIAYDIKNSSTELLSLSEVVGDVERGNIETVSIPVKVDLKKLYELEYPHFYHFFHNDTLDLNLTLSLKYMLGLVTFKVNFNQDVEWTPPIEEVALYSIQEYSMDDNGIYFILPYMIRTADYLDGMANVSGVIKGENGVIGDLSTNFLLGTTYHGNLTGLIYYDNAGNLIVKSQWLHLMGNVSFLGLLLPFNTLQYWGAPLSNLTYQVLSNNTLYYSFTDESSMALNLFVNRTYYYQGNFVKKETTHLYVNSGEHVERYEDLNITQPVDQVVISFYDVHTGIYYEEVIYL